MPEDPVDLLMDAALDRSPLGKGGEDLGHRLQRERGAILGGPGADAQLNTPVAADHIAQPAVGAARADDAMASAHQTGLDEGLLHRREIACRQRGGGQDIGRSEGADQVLVHVRLVGKHQDGAPLVHKRAEGLGEVVQRHAAAGEGAGADPEQLSAAGVVQAEPGGRLTQVADDLAPADMHRDHPEQLVRLVEPMNQGRQVAADGKLGKYRRHLRQRLPGGFAGHEDGALPVADDDGQPLPSPRLIERRKEVRWIVDLPPGQIELTGTDVPVALVVDDLKALAEGRRRQTIEIEDVAVGRGVFVEQLELRPEHQHPRIELAGEPQAPQQDQQAAAEAIGALADDPA